MPSSKTPYIDEKLFQERLTAFNPEPLVKYDKIKDKQDIEIECIKENNDVIDLAKTNFLNVLNNDDIKNKSEEIIRKYGVGTCGPRAFYGTTDIHLKLEDHIAKFLNMDEAIVYSYGFVAISSSIAAYCKKSDIVFTHRDCNIAIKQGLQMAKSKVIYFDHGNTDSFTTEVEKIVESEKDKKKLARKFLIVEGVSWKTGQIVCLPELLKVAEENKIRVFLEESYSIGILGKTGKGLLEHFKIEPYRVDLIISTLESAIGSIGGFCAGSHTAIEHQRLSGNGYIFSASLPTYLVQACIESINLITEETAKKLKVLSEHFHSTLTEIGYEVLSDPLSAFKVFTINEKDEEKKRYKEQKVYQFCKNNGLYLIYQENGLIANLNITLADHKEKYAKVQNILSDAFSQ
ncbi:serine palmitoyltransferase subunit I [Rhynchophorus ferrugineus]|uniref:Serine palmitoyltransferase 1 n=1 Tax=Rhynchophorus ferrugineus TaxID=354439 RepID=A0A834HYN8_RHYFE|nr:hypothetical protein GWI33_017481 [Rhynchophorus ferrugineus]